MGGTRQSFDQWLAAPLTTIFTPPSNCQPGPTLTLGSGSNNSVILGSGPYDDNTFIHGYTSSCFPESAYEIFYADEVTNGVAGYSPGLCPFGWSTAQAIIQPPQTTAFCCPESLLLNATYAHDFWCASGFRTAFVVSGELTTSYTSVELFVRGFAVTQADSDKALLASATAPSSTTTSVSTAASSDSSSLSTTATPGASVSGVTSPTATNSQPEPGPGLSTGAKAGIGVSAAIGALLIIGIVILFLWRKRRQRKATLNQSQVIDSDKFEKAELSGESKQVPELKATHIYEADATGRPGEMSNSNVRAELEGDWRGWEAPGHDR